MGNRLYYIMSFLPVLPGLGHAPPVTMEELFRIMQEERSKKVRTLAKALNFATLLRQAAENRVLGCSLADVLGACSIEPGAPPVMVDLFLLDPQEVGEDFWLTKLWREYFSLLENIGKSVGSSLLVRWAHWEGSLREQMMEVRRQSAGVVADGESVRGRATAWDHGGIIAGWRKTADPLAGERLLDEARIGFIEAESPRYSFGIDELAAYFLKLGLLLRHAALNREAGIRILEEVTAV